jgi:hypothetical protein
MAIIDAVKRNAGTSRVFAFGIGSSVNRFLLDGMAQAGRGEVHPVAPVGGGPPALGDLRRAIDERRRVALEYQSKDWFSERTVRPVALFFWGQRWSLAAWCELRGDWRNFREDRIRRFWARHPSQEWRGMPLVRLNAYLDADLERVGPFLLRFYGRGLTETDDPLYSHRIRFANTARSLRLFHPEVLRDAAAMGDPAARLEASLPADFGTWSPLARAQYLEVRTMLEGTSTRRAIACSWGTPSRRFPYLDHRVADFAGRPRRDEAARPARETPAAPGGRAALPDAITRAGSTLSRAHRARAARPRAPDYVGEVSSADRVRDAGVFSLSQVGDLPQPTGDRSANRRDVSSASRRRCPARALRGRSHARGSRHAEPGRSARRRPTAVSPTAVVGSLHGSG